MDELKWTELRIYTTYEGQDAIAHVLQEAGVTGIVIEDAADLTVKMNKHDALSKSSTDSICIKAYLQDKQLTEKKIKHLQESINNISGYGLNIGTGDMSHSPVEEDWETAWEKYYKPIKISNKIMIVPTWEEKSSFDKDTFIIELDPGLAFGTGSHATTALCLRALEQYVENDYVVIDVGCGSGILSIASRLLGAKHVIAIDQDELAVNSTRNNAELNNVLEDLTITKSDLLADNQQKADIIVANILAEVIITFVDDAWAHLNKDGLFITSGIIERKQALVVEELQRCGFNIIDIQSEAGWVCIIAQK